MNVLKPAEMTMTPDEAEAIVRRFMDRENAPAEGPRVADLAEALRVSPEEVAEMLAQVRAEPLPKRKRRVVRRERRLWLLTGLAALIIGGLAIGGMRSLHWGPFALPETTTSTTTEAAETTTATVAAAPGSQWSPGEYGVFLNGTFFGDSADLDRVERDGWDAWVERNAPFASLIGTPIDAEADRRSRDFVLTGQWERIVGVRFDTLNIRQYSENHKWLLWATATIPVYTGDDALVAKAVEAERRRRVIEAAKDAAQGLGSGAKA